MTQTIYDFTVVDATGKPVNLGERYKGKVVIIVNVASECGKADENYTQLRELYIKFHEQGLRVACFPCNQFMSQEPGCEVDIRNTVAQKYAFEPDFYAKVKVNGDHADPLWKFLKDEKGGVIVDAIKWNFSKFLVNKQGIVVKRYGPTTDPKEMTEDIERALIAL